MGDGELSVLDTPDREIPASVTVSMAREQLSADRPLVIRARGQSMWPVLRDGQELTIFPVGEEGVRVGDIVLYVTGDQMILHRVIRKRPGSYLLKGDAMGSADRWVEPPDILGRIPRRIGAPVMVLISRIFGNALTRCGAIYRRFFDQAAGRS